MTNRIVSLLLAIGLLLALLCGCEKKEKSSSGGAVSIRTITILGDSERNKVYSDIIRSYTADKPQVYLRDISAVPADAFKLNVTLESTYRTTETPHVVYYYSDTGIWDMRDEFVSLYEIRRDYPDFASDVRAQAIDSANGAKPTQYCVPVMGSWCAVAVNTALMEKCGAAVPASWNELLSTIDVLSSNKIIPFANPADDCGAVLELLVAAYGGGEALQYGVQRESDVIESAWLTALQRLAELSDSGAFAPAAITKEITQSGNYTAVSQSDVVSDGDASALAVTSGSDASTSDTQSFYTEILGERDETRRLDAISLFNAGKAAMIVIDSEDIGDITVSDISVAAMPLPDDITQPGGMLISFREGCYITRSAYDNPETRGLVIELVERMSDAQAGAQFAALGYFPAAGGVQCDGFNARVQELANGLETWVGTTRTDANLRFWSQVNKYTGELQYGVVTARQIADILARPEE